MGGAGGDGNSGEEEKPGCLSSLWQHVQQHLHLVWSSSTAAQAPGSGPYHIASLSLSPGMEGLLLGLAVPGDSEPLIPWGTEFLHELSFAIPVNLWLTCVAIFKAQ